jgi:putative protease
MEAKNFTLGELAALTALAHAKGTRVFVAFNTLITSDELDEAGRLLGQLQREVHPDAVIVQDLAMAPLVRQTYLAGEVIWSTSKQSGVAGGAGSGASGCQRSRRQGWVNVPPAKPASQD